MKALDGNFADQKYLENFKDNGDVKSITKDARFNKSQAVREAAKWIKDNYWLTVLAGIPISMLFMYSVKNMITAFNGEMWPSRLIGFSIGAMVFTLLSWKVFEEPLTTKTYVCLFLSFLILVIQLFWK
jgi:hypothetical protein